MILILQASVSIHPASVVCIPLLQQELPIEINIEVNVELLQRVPKLIGEFRDIEHGGLMVGLQEIGMRVFMELEWSCP